MVALTPAFAVLLPFVTLSSAVPASPRQGPVRGLQIHPANDTTKCLDLAGDITAGTETDIVPCGNTPVQAHGWLIPASSGQIQLADTDYCLDAGTPPFPVGPVGVFLPVTIESCSGGPTQTWTIAGKLFEVENPPIAGGGERCMAATDDNANVVTKGCDESDPSEQWTTS